jgi:hypothetical protein
MNAGGTIATERQAPPRRRALSGPQPLSRPGDRPSRRWTILSIALHIALVMLLAQALVAPYALRTWFASVRESAVPRERITFVAPRPQAEPIQAPRATTTREPSRTATPAPPIIAPREIPTTLPPPAPAPAPVGVKGNEDITGPLTGGTGPTRGIQPSYADPRVWSPPENIAAMPKTSARRIDSATVSIFSRYNDSVYANAYTPSKYERGDWTYEKDGKKYGIDQQYLHLGKVSIPLPLLALLPINVQSNPIAYERNKQFGQMRSEIMEHAQTAMNEDDFRRAVKNLRERKEREKKEQEKKNNGKTVATPGSSDR